MEEAEPQLVAIYAPVDSDDEELEVAFDQEEEEEQQQHGDKPKKKKHKKHKKHRHHDDDDEEELEAIPEELREHYKQELAAYATARKHAHRKGEHRHSSSASKSYLADEASDEDGHSSDEEEDDEAASDVGEDGHVLTTDVETGERISLVVPDDEAEAMESDVKAELRASEARKRARDLDKLPSEMPEVLKERLQKRRQEYENEKKEEQFIRASQRRLYRSSMDYHLKRRLLAANGHAGSSDDDDDDPTAGNDDDDGFVASDDEGAQVAPTAAEELPEEATEEEAKRVLEAIDARDPLARKRKQRERHAEALRRLSKRRKGKQKVQELLREPSPNEEEEEKNGSAPRMKQTTLCLVPRVLEDGPPAPKDASRRRFEQLLRYWVCAELDGRFVDSLWKQQSGLNAAPASSMFKTKSAKELLADVKLMTSSRDAITCAMVREISKLTDRSAPDCKFAYLIFHASFLGMRYTRYQGERETVCPISGQPIRYNDEVMLLTREPPKQPAAAAAVSPAEREYIYVRKSFGLKVHLLMVYVHWESFSTGLIEQRIRSLPTVRETAFSDKVLRLMEDSWIDYMYAIFSNAEMFVVRQLELMSGGSVRMYDQMLGKYKP